MANIQIEINATVAADATSRDTTPLDLMDQLRDRSWSARKSADMVRRKMCPDTSWPLRRRGRAVAHWVEAVVEAKRSGWVSGERSALLLQYSTGTVMYDVASGDTRTHSPPVATRSLSSMGGPKNQLVNSIHEAVATKNLDKRSPMRVSGLERTNMQKAAEVQAHAFLIK